jgi:transcriptional regulator with AAA-type ATPase domain/transcriptional regulatory protein LevR
MGKDSGVTASELADRLGLSRANVSSDLNRLCEEGSAVKNGTKPVYYSISAAVVKEPEKQFDIFLRENPSLFPCGELAKAAVLYPPRGMHILLFGETGVGKSMFARMIFDYALDLGRIERENSFVAFNCADYANNPQLLVGQIFGVTRGAYTGADSDRPGLLERADGGILFLDEVHRLPPEGQEMLFSYIDNGQYHRLGETGTGRSASVMLVCATTEDPESALLRAFVRRIPMQIKIPSLRERGSGERLKLISRFFTGEFHRLGSPVLVSVNSIRALLGYPCAGNVGQLKADIQLLCARAYADFISRRKEKIIISSFVLPPQIRDGLFAETDRKKIWNLFSGVSSRFISFDGAENSSPPGGEGTDIYDAIERRTEELRRVGADQKQIDEVISAVMADFYGPYGEKGGEGAAAETAGTEITATVDKMLALASRELGRSFNENLRAGLSLHLVNALRRVQQGLPIVNPRLENIRKEIPAALAAAEKALEIAERDFNIRFPPGEAGFVALFLEPGGQKTQKKASVCVIVLAHGTGIATGLAATANRLLGSGTVLGFDVPLDSRPHEVYQKLVECLGTSGAADALLLVDMGSLASYACDLERDLGIRVRIVTMASTLHVLEAGRKALLGYSLHDIWEDVQRLGERMGGTGNLRAPAAQGKGQKLYLLTVCTTGEGSAQAMKEYLAERLDLKGGFCEIVPLQLSDSRSFDEESEELRARGGIVAVVSAFDTPVPAPHFKLSLCMSAAGIILLQKRIDTELLFLEVADTMAQNLPALGDPGVPAGIRETIERISRALGIELSGDMLIGVFCHLGCMVDRLKRGEGVKAFPGRQALTDRYPIQVEIIRRECGRLAELCGVEIPPDEICYMTAFFMKEDLI